MKVKAGRSEYVVTPDDRLWLLRAVQAEGAPESAVASALVNLHALRRAQGRRETMAELVRSYAQPVNPRWYPGGDLFLAAVSAARKEQREQMQTAAERRRQLHSARTVFDAHVISAVEAALRGEHRNDVTDYAAPWVDASGKGYVARSEPRRGENRLWTRKPGWSGYVAEGGAVAAAGGVLLALVALGVLLVVAG